MTRKTQPFKSLVFNTPYKTYDEFYEDLSGGHINEGVLIWHPYQNHTAFQLLQAIDGYANMFIDFYNECEGNE